MRNFIFFFIICLSVFQMNCFPNKNEVSNSNLTNENLVGKEISSETAVLIAKGRLLGEYNFENYDIVIKENEKNWIVIFSRKATGCCGGSPYVTIDKSDGRIVDVTHGK